MAPIHRVGTGPAAGIALEVGKYGADLLPDLPLPAGINEGVNQGVRKPQQPQMVLQEVVEPAVGAQQLDHTDREEGAPGEGEASHQQRHGPQGLDVAPVAAGLAVACTSLAGLPDLPLVPAGDLEDVHVEVEEDAQQREEAAA